MINAKSVTKRFSDIKIFESSDTNVKKFVFETPEVQETHDNPEILFAAPITDFKKASLTEAVLYRYGSYKERTVICCSIQSGCPVGCTFCGTGKFFIRNLTAWEIVGQIEEVMSTIDCAPEEIKKFQIMFMSMGEPMCNYSELESAIRHLHHKYPTAQLLVSTSAPSITYKHIGKFIQLSKEIDKVGLQFSVHESTDENRKKLIPTDTCTLRQISAIGEMWSAFVGRKPFFNYCVHEGNNTPEDAKRLADIFDPKVWEVTLSVICEKDETVSNSISRQLEIIKDFNQEMLNLGFSLRIFNPAGQDDIGGGCGQLWYFQKWLGDHNK